MAKTISILDMAPKGRYADGSPIYEFSCPLPTRGVTVLPKAFNTSAEAQADMEDIILNDVLASRD